MARGPGDRGVSEVVGFILIFGMVVISFTVYQGIVVPEQNRQVEFQHNQQVQGEFQNLRNAIVGTAATGSGQAVSVTLGATYPRRTIAQNLGVSAGSLRTTRPGPLRIQNVTTLEPEAGDYVAGSLGPFETSSLRYLPTYSFYTNPPATVYENTLVYNRFDGTNLTVTDQVMIDGRRITLVALDGSASEASRDLVSVSTKPISAPTNQVAIRNTSGGPVTITIPTALPASEWEDIVAAEHVDNGGYVEAVLPVADADAVSFVLRANQVYELRIAKVGIGSATTEEPPKYVTTVQGDDTSVPEGGSRTLVVETRDRFNNPVSNVTVSADPPADGAVATGPQITDGAGRASFVYTAPPDVTGTRDVEVVVAFDGDGTANESATFDLSVLDTDGSAGDGSSGVDQVNPSGAGAVTLVDQSTIPPNGDDTLTLTLDNTGDSPVNVTGARISFFLTGGPSQGGERPTSARLYSGDGDVPAADGTDLEIGADYAPLATEIPLSPTGTTTVDLDFDTDVQNSDFYVVSLGFSDGSTYTYFVSHP